MGRIATITSGPPTGTGGTDRHLAALKRCFEEDGHTVECYHFEQLNPPRPWTFVDRLGYRIPGHGRILAERIRFLRDNPEVGARQAAWGREMVVERFSLQRYRAEWRRRLEKLRC